MKSGERKDSQPQQPSQQPPSSDRQQQQQGGRPQGNPQAQPGGQQQQAGQGGGQYGEGNYEATRQYNAGLKEHVEKQDIEREARDAAPKSDAQARDMERAEEEGKRRAKDGGGAK